MLEKEDYEEINYTDEIELTACTLLALFSQCIPRCYIHEDCAVFPKLATFQESTQNLVYLYLIVTYTKPNISIKQLFVYRNVLSKTMTPSHFLFGI